jgi:signal transduction histidine kinase/ActR/RegA family two-component response regulator
MESEASQPRPQAARAWLTVASLWLAMAAFAVLALWHLRHEAMNSQARELTLLSLLSTDAIERGVFGAEEGLHALRAEIEDGRLSLSGEVATQSLQTRADLMPLVEALWVLNTSGQVIAGSKKHAPPEATSFVPELGSLERGGLSMSRAFSGPNETTNGSASLVALAIRFTGPPQGGGWIVAAVPASALLGALGAALPAADARMLVLRRDGIRLASVNAADKLMTRVDGNARRASRPSMGLHTFSDGSENLVGIQSVPRYGVEVLVSRDLASVLGTWRQAAELAAAALSVLLVVMIAALYFVQLADRRRAEALRALQAQASRTSKLESLGTLAGGVAHDFNNVLAGIVGFGEMAQDAAEPGSAQARHLDKMMQAALRGKALVERILAFSRGGAKVSSVFQLEPVVAEVLTLLSASLRSGILLERTIEAPGVCVKGDATQAFEAVMNLCTNAMQAMPHGGLLSVRLVRVTITEPRILSHTQLAAGAYAALTVADQGSGISPQVMDHLFEPFFTTKAAQSGTGLGLAVVFGVVAEFGGAIDVQSSPGQGARFTLYLPECKQDVTAEVAQPRQAHVGTGQRLLVVDDEPELVALTVEMLQGLGYAPEGFSDAAAALKALQDDPHGYAAVITDEVMPGLTGTQLTRALRPLAPRVPVLLLSGYGGALLAQHASAAGVNRVLAKPVQRAGLAQALAEVLRGA